MEVAETLNGVDQLAMGVSVERRENGDAHQSKPVQIRMFPNVFPQFPSWHPI